MKKLFKQYLSIQKQINEIDSEISEVTNSAYYKNFGSETEQRKEISGLTLKKQRLVQELSDIACMIATKLNEKHSKDANAA